MATIEALRPGDEVCIKVPDSPIMRVLAVEGLKARCADSENLQYWFDTVMLERHEPPHEHCEMSSTEIYKSASANALPDPDQSCSRRNSKANRSSISQSVCRQIFGPTPNSCCARRKHSRRSYRRKLLVHKGEGDFGSPFLFTKPCNKSDGLGLRFGMRRHVASRGELRTSILSKTN